MLEKNQFTPLHPPIKGLVVSKNSLSEATNVFHISLLS